MGCTPFHYMYLRATIQCRNFFQVSHIPCNISAFSCRGTEKYYLSCLFVGLCIHPDPVELLPHQRHLLAPEQRIVTQHPVLLMIQGLPFYTNASKKAVL